MFMNIMYIFKYVNSNYNFKKSTDNKNENKNNDSKKGHSEAPCLFITYQQLLKLLFTSCDIYSHFEDIYSQYIFSCPSCTCISYLFHKSTVIMKQLGTQKLLISG